MEYVNIADISLALKADFAFKITDSTLEPMYHKGDYMLVQQCPTISHGELGVFVINSTYYARQMYLKDGKCRLVSLNLDTADITVDDKETLHCVGKVVGSIRQSESR